MEGILFIRKLYKVESDADDKGLSAEERMEQRRKISYPTILMFEKWIEETYARVLPKSRLGEALAYAYSLLPRLSRYVNDGRINIDNNLIENAIRPLALGRKNYLFCGNDASAYRAAIVYSLIGTCRAAGSTREHGWRMCSANCLTGSATAMTSRDSCPEPGQRKTKSLPSSTNQVRLEPTSYKLGLVGPNSNILCQINTVLTGRLLLIDYITLNVPPVAFSNVPLQTWSHSVRQS